MAKGPLKIKWEHPGLGFSSARNFKSGACKENGLESLINKAMRRWETNQSPLLTVQDQRVLRTHPQWLIPALWECVSHYGQNGTSVAFQIRRWVLSELLFYLNFGGKTLEVQAFGKAFQLEIIHFLLRGAYPRELQRKIVDLVLGSSMSLDPEFERTHRAWVSGGGRKWKKVEGKKPSQPAVHNETLNHANSFHLAKVLHQELVSLDVESQLRWLGLMASSEDAYGLEILPLLLVHPCERLRQSIPELLQGMLFRKRFTSQMLRRLLVLRNWVPLHERVGLDRLVRRARLQGVEPNSLEPGKLVRCFISNLEDRHEQAFWSVVSNSNGHLASLMLLDPKRGLTELSTWDLENLGDFDEEIRLLRQKVYVFPVDPAILEAAVRQGLRKGLEQDCLPPYQLLRLAEALGNLGWNADSREPSEILEAGYSELEGRYRKPENVQRILVAASARPFQKLTETWKICPAEIEYVLCRVLGTSNRPLVEDVAVDGICDKVLEVHRQHWLDQLLWTTQWLKAAPHCAPKLWPYFWVTAKEVLHSRPLREIPFFRMLAQKAIQNAGFPENRPNRKQNPALLTLTRVD